MSAPGARGESASPSTRERPASAALSLAADAVGVGLRPPFHRPILADWPAVDYFEIISENYLRPESLPARNLERIAARYPVVLHGTTLGLLGHAPLDERYLGEVKELADRLAAPFVTDHLCWTAAHGIQHHDLLPAPATADLLEYAVLRAEEVQRRLGRRFGIENLSSYVSFRDSTLPEWEFYSRVVRESGCWFMLDINNVYVSSVNHGFDARAYLDAVDYDRVLQVHLAGHTRLDDGSLLDTHDHPVAEEVWSLYRYAWSLGGPFPTLLEWDARIPPLPDVLREADRARRVRA